MELSINDLGSVLTAVFKASTKWYNIGLMLKVAVPTLERIGFQFDNPTDRLREILKAWLETAAKPTWRDIVGALRGVTVGHSKLASDINTRYCTTDETGQASGQTMPDVQQPQLTRGTELQTLRQALQDTQELLRLKDQLQDSQRCMHTQQQELQDSQKTHTPSRKENSTVAEIRREQTIRELQTSIDKLKWQLQQAQQQVEEKQHKIEEKERQVQELTKQLQDVKGPGTPPQKLVMQQKGKRDMRWQKESEAPEKMRRGSAASDYNMAYFSDRGSTTVHSFHSDTREWHRLPDTPHTYFTLVVVRHILTIVGGLISGEVTGTLLSLVGEGRDKKWLPNRPAMPTKRYFTAVVCSGCSLIVAGGKDGLDILVTVEVLDTDTQQWSIASSLSHPFSLATISICGERLYMLGGYDQTGYWSRSVLSCSVPELLQSCQPQPLTGKLRTTPANQSTIWRHVADAPHYYSSCVTLCGQLVAVGGGEKDKNTTAITVYNKTTDSWDVMGNMPTARRLALVAILTGKMMVVGGYVGETATDVVEMYCS